MKEFIQHPLCTALKTPQLYKGKTFPCIIIHRLHVWYLKHVQPLTNPTSCPSHLSCQRMHLSLSVPYWNLTSSKLRLPLYVITWPKLDMNSWQENYSISCTKVWSTGRSVLYNTESSNQLVLRGMGEVKKVTLQCHTKNMCIQARTACMRFTHHSHHSSLGRENEQRAIPACCLGGEGTVKLQAAHSASRLVIEVTAQVQCHLLGNGKKCDFNYRYGKQGQSTPNYCTSQTATIMSYSGLGHTCNTFVHSLGFDLSQQGYDCSACAVTLCKDWVT